MNPGVPFQSHARHGKEFVEGQVRDGLLSAVDGFQMALEVHSSNRADGNHRA
jgi:hypothetical protein